MSIGLSPAGTLAILGGRVGLMFVGTLLALAQNVVWDGHDGPTVPPIQLSPAQAITIVELVPARASVAIDSPDARRIADQLDAHLRELIDGWPWMPFHHTHGISGYEAFFTHPDELFHALAFALPFLPPPTADRARAFLRELLSHSPPFAAEGWESRVGQPRESYTVPPHLRFSGRRQARSTFGVYAFWAYCHFADDLVAARSHWPAIQARIQPLLDAPYVFDIHRKDHTRDEAQQLNGNLAGLIGYIRLARLLGEPNIEPAALPRLTECLELRVNLERVNPRLLDRAVASRTLHLYKLARYSDLTPEIAHALRRWTDGLAETRIRSFREFRPAWWLAFGDRTIGGENYTNPPHFPRSLFAAAALIEELPADSLLQFTDVPWCKADLYFIERCALALRAAAAPSVSAFSPAVPVRPD